ncbi:type I secretion system permease/ATPase [Acidovorax sp. CCYZU-2555]|uniref:type I secretion system permease/ATPase n=1 Tax=Acidovorax sp. CCYZU-2555 TaxID=2835042 RepID=UPI001BCCCE61|nr:type I secretion system permease/ATPase [Acidovorax sp. CCYZU-2555]MBS7779120.1 type I secretion system permease/ATPase [Acidovorax sp. CCYZU-2555]
MKSPAFFQRSELTQALWSFRREFAMVGLFSMLANLLLLSPTMYMLQVFDRVMASQNELTLLMMSLITLFLFMVMAFSEWMRSKVLVRSGVRLDNLLGARIFEASFEARLSRQGDAAQRAFGDLLQVRQFLTGNGIFALFDAPWTPIYLGVLYLLHPVLAGIALCFALAQAGLVWFGHRKSVAPAQAATEASTEARSYLQSKLRNVEVLEPMGMVHHLLPHWTQRYCRSQGLHGKAQSLTHRITAWSKFIRYAQQSLGLGAGALLVINNQLSPGEMIAANVLMTRTLAPIDQLVGTWRGFIAARAAFGRLESLLQAHPQRDPRLQRTAPVGSVVLRDVVAHAQARATPILQGVTLQLEPGSITAILGPSGSGKSTLARCIIGVWPQVSGEVLLDERPLAGWDRRELGPYLGYLPQDIELFEGSIAENIARFGDIDPDKVIAATRSAGLHEMVLRFPKGYDTPMGEAGNLLSGGQRQRIALARAIYGRPRLVVLDEPNANLDDAGEAALVHVLQELRTQGSTVVIVTHRQGILAAADRVVVLRNGLVERDGARDAVLASIRNTAPAGTPSPRLLAL